MNAKVMQMASFVVVQVVFEEDMPGSLERVAKDIARILEEALRKEGYFDFKVQLRDYFYTTP